MARNVRHLVRQNVSQFLSANGWDVHGAASFGFKVLWINRAGAPRERLPGDPVGEIVSLSELPEWLGL